MKYPLTLIATLLLTALVAMHAAEASKTQKLGKRVEMDLSGPGWSLWRDDKAEWKNDELFAPPVDLTKLPVNPPTGGWDQLDDAKALAVSIPGTVEGYLFKHPGLAETKPEKLYSPYFGVSWWFRTVKVPTTPDGGRLLLRFDSVRLRAEVFVNRKLVAYDLVGNSPFEVDITDAVKPGEECQIAVRVTNPGGNFDWVDCDQIEWGKYVLPQSHGFGGITGGVKLLAVDAAYIDDLSVQNTPAMHDVNVNLIVKNLAAGPVTRDVLVSVVEKNNPSVKAFSQTLKDVIFQPGENNKTVAVSVRTAKLWDVDHPNLYVCKAELKSAGILADATQQTFGFRWLALDGIGKNAMLRLNGKRIFFRTAISWSFWPGNGMTPTPELAEKQIRIAKEFGLNMLNFHRAIGQPIAMEKADEIGLLYFEEPGGYVGAGTQKFGQALSREKLLRMVKRDRSHPSVVIYNMINEQWLRDGADKNDALHAIRTQDMRDAHAIDPSRLILYASAWATKNDEEERVKMHMRPFDDTLYYKGWWDAHRADGPELWLQDFYKDPLNHYGKTDNVNEIVYWGEEGAVSAPSRLEKIKADVEKMQYAGWDGEIYLGQHKAFADFLERKKLALFFPTVDAFTSALSVPSHEHQGRKIEDTRICDLNDGYTVNGWEDEPFENHSGVVDCWRNSKADPAILAYYNQPLYIAVKVRSQVVQIPGEVVTDFYAVNEKDLKGPFTLKVRATDPAGKEIFKQERNVTLQGGDVFGQLLAEGVKIPVDRAAGMIRIEADLVDASGAKQASGHDEILSVDWKSAKITGKGAVYATDDKIRDFLRTQKSVDVPAFDDTQGPLDWIVIARPPNPEPRLIEAENFTGPDGQPCGLAATFFEGRKFGKELHQRRDKDLNVQWPKGATPDPAVNLIGRYSVRWEGQITPPVSGQYWFELKSEGGVGQLWIDGRELASTGISKTPGGAIELVAGKPVSIKVEYARWWEDGDVRLLWSPPGGKGIDPSRLFERAHKDGTRLIVLENAGSWADVGRKELGIRYDGAFPIGKSWAGGQFFVRSHPLFKDLPVNQAMDWPYQQIVRGAHGRYGMRMDGEELVAGCYNNPAGDCFLGTAVGIVPCGKGEVLLSSLEIASRLSEPPGPSDVARKLFCNYMEWAANLTPRPSE
jgi:hypothetical protein